jgi:SH3-like domain-containing protein
LDRETLRGMRKTMNRLLAGLTLTLCALSASPAQAQDRDVPYWASLRVDEVNMRVGPAETYKIDWVYRRNGLPLKVVRRQEGWRLVEDEGGTRGWMVSRYLSRDRAAIVVGRGNAEMRSEPSAGAQLRWRLAPGVSGKLGKCEAGWCQLDVAGRKGYVPEERLWGAGEP